jgi:hypothetical protein
MYENLRKKMAVLEEVGKQPFVGVLKPRKWNLLLCSQGNQALFIACQRMPEFACNFGVSVIIILVPEHFVTGYLEYLVLQGCIGANMWGKSCLPGKGQVYVEHTKEAENTCKLERCRRCENSV